MNQFSFLAHNSSPDSATSHALRNLTLSALSRMERISSRHKLDSIYSRVLDLRARISENRFQVGVVGQFKRGKTSVLNALLGTELLPVGAVPFTAVLTTVKFGDSTKAEVKFQSGDRLPISLSQLSDFVSERGNPGNARKVDHVGLSFPSYFLRDDIVFVNSPGFGGPYEHLTHVAYDLLSRIDAAIFVTSPDPPLTSAEIDFLKMLRTSVGRVFVVMNKADVCDRTALAAVVCFTTPLIAAALGRQVPVYVTSSTQVLSGRALEASVNNTSRTLDQLKRDLGDFLEGERGTCFRLSSLYGALNIARDLRLRLQSQKESADLSERHLKTNSLDLDYTLNRLLDQYDQNEASLKRRVEQIGSLIDSEVARFSESRISFIVSAAKGYFCQCKSMSRAELQSSVSGFIGWQIQRAFDEWRPDFEKSVEDAAREAFERFSQSTDAVIDHLRQLALELAQVGVYALRDEPESSSTSYHTQVFTHLNIEYPMALLPGPVFGWYLLRKATEIGSAEMQRNADLLMADIKGRLKRHAFTLYDGVSQRLHEIVDRLREDRRSGEGGCPLQLALDLQELDRVVDELNASLGVKYALEA